MVSVQKNFQIYLYQKTVRIALNDLSKIQMVSTKEKNRLHGYSIRHHKSNMFAEFKKRNWKELKLDKYICMVKFYLNDFVLIHPFFIIHSKVVIHKNTYIIDSNTYSIKDTSNLFVGKLAKYFSNIKEEQQMFFNQYIKVYKLNMAYQY